MVIGREYLLEKPAGPSSPKLFLDRQIIPLAVNIAGSAEVALSRASARTGIKPAFILLGITGIVSLALFRLLSPRYDGKRHS